MNMLIGSGIGCSSKGEGRQLKNYKKQKEKRIKKIPELLQWSVISIG